MEKAIFFPVGGLQLEGMFYSAGDLGAVICHPHPLYGGSMENNVVHAAAQTLQRHGWSTLRFNFRGVGRSQGSTGDGTDETEDVLAAIAFLQERQGIPPHRVVLIGYSYGAWVGLRALGRSRSLLGWVAIAPPVGIWDFSFAAGIAGKKLILAGDRDEFCPQQALKDFFDSLQEPKECRIVQGADHFFWSQESALSRAMELVAKSWADG
jgi:alpha/beta superfamily hydrolase